MQILLPERVAIFFRAGMEYNQVKFMGSQVRGKGRLLRASSSSRGGTDPQKGTSPHSLTTQLIQNCVFVTEKLRTPAEAS